MKIVGHRFRLRRLGDIVLSPDLEQAMTGQSSNDNSLPKLMQDFPDAHGQAAILLVESLMHGLIAQSLITVAGALEVIEVALDVARNTEEELSDPAVSQLRASTLLQAMSKSLSHDLPKGARSD